MSDIEIREEMAHDVQAIDRVNRLAFNRPDEPRLVTELRAKNKIALSLVALEAGQIVGHILFTPMRVIYQDGAEGKALGLGPLAVLPKFQRHGFGGALVKEGLEQCRAAGQGVVFVLGHPSYYPRFGFQPALNFDLRCAYDVPEDAFMVLELQPGSLRHGPGVVHYEPQFDGV